MAKLRLLVLVCTFALIAAACGGSAETTTNDGDTDTGGSDTTEPADSGDDDGGGDEGAGDEDDGGGDDGGDDDAGGDDGGGDVELTASWRGVTEDTITIGASMLDFPGLIELGLSTEGWGDQPLVWQTFVDDLNARGGINGRMVEVIPEYYNVIDPVAAEETCVKLTQDNEVFAVLGGFLGPVEPVNTCVVGINETILINGVITPERLAEAEAPWVQPAALRTRRLDVFLDLLDQEGMLEGKKVAVVGSVEQADLADVAPAALEARGITPVAVIANDVPQGDIVGSDDAWKIFAEKIDAEGADAVLVIGSGQAAVRGMDANGLDVEKWLLESNALSNLGAETNKESARDAITVTGMTDDERWEQEDTLECRRVFSEAHPDIELKAPADVVEGEEAWFNSIINYCSWLSLFEKIATEAGPELTHESFAAAMGRLGDISLPGIPFGSLTEGKLDVSNSFRLSIFDPDASDPGDLKPLTDILNGGG